MPENLDRHFGFLVADVARLLHRRFDARARRVGLTRAQCAVLARLAQQAGLDGVVASPKEVGLIRAACGKDFAVVTPGVRPSFAALDDQKRGTTPAERIAAGADFLWIGRPGSAALPVPLLSAVVRGRCRAARRWPRFPRRRRGRPAATLSPLTLCDRSNLRLRWRCSLFRSCIRQLAQDHFEWQFEWQFVLAWACLALASAGEG